jgi:hypothetical protein
MVETLSFDLPPADVFAHLNENGSQRKMISEIRGHQAEPTRQFK